MRIDKLLWYLRLAKTRTIAQTMAESGHLRAAGRRIERAHHRIAQGDVLTLVRQDRVLAIEILSLPVRRGPAAEAQSCYRVLDGTPQFPLAAPEINQAAERDLQP